MDFTTGHILDQNAASALHVEEYFHLNTESFSIKNHFTGFENH